MIDLLKKCDRNKQGKCQVLPPGMLGERKGHAASRNAQVRRKQHKKSGKKSDGFDFYERRRLDTGLIMDRN